MGSLGVYWSYWCSAVVAELVGVQYLVSAVTTIGHKSLRVIWRNIYFFEKMAEAASIYSFLSGLGSGCLI